ncbi:MAG TPA: substrate-binding domain-containing protein [Casimicrobiaceae bacterium]|nr:substrate-binding domain-containing protein [Casimicrobiaceae bacterium]
MTDLVYVISAGAAKGLVEAVRDDFEQASSCTIEAQFGAVGAMKEALLQGAPCDVLILTQRMLEDLAREDMIEPDSMRALGRVYTGIAVPAGTTHPDIHDAPALARALSRASAIYFPDPQRATAGIHFAKVIAQLELSQALAARLRPFPNGATAMRAMADARDPDAIGCTQASEILYTRGVELAGVLPNTFELSTVYSACVCRSAQSPLPGRQFIELLAGPDSKSLRERGGFMPV